MKSIRELSDNIAEEIDDAEKYILLALEYKEKDPELAKLYYSLSADELGHSIKLHTSAVKEIEMYKQEKGEPPADMMAVYEYLHKKNIEHTNKVRMYQSQY
jgi:hypothetical protein